MTTSAIGTHSHGTHSHGTHSHGTSIDHRPAARRPALDVLVEGVAMRLLAWSVSRAQKNQLTHERMALILETQRNETQRNLVRGRSSLGH